MKRIIKNILTTIVAIATLFSSLGLQIFIHTCKTHNYFAASFVEKPGCEKDFLIETEVDNCCKAEVIEEASCCDIEDNSEIDYPIIKSKDNSCCVTTIQESHTVDNLFLTADKKINSCTDDLFFTELIKSEKQNSNQINKINSSDLPPPLFGKNLLKKIHQLKLDTPFC